MGNVQQGKWVVPNPQIPRSFGLMNIIFGSLLVLVAMGYAAWLFYLPTFSRWMQAGMQQQAAQVKAGNAERIADLKKQEAAAKTEEEKAELKSEREAIEQKNQVDMSGFSDLTGMNVMNDWRVAAYYYAEIFASVVLNVLMIVAGGGLLGLTEWGRRLGILVAQLKILRWIAMTILTMVIILPISLEMSRKGINAVQAQINAQRGGRGMPLPLTEFARFGMIMGAVGIIFSAVVASIYPAMLWWYLSRPAARAACMKQPEPELSEPDPQWEKTV